MTGSATGILILLLVVLATAVAVEAERRRQRQREADAQTAKRLSRVLDLRAAGARVKYHEGMDAPYDQSKPVEAAKRAAAETDRRRELAARRASQGATDSRGIVPMRRTRG